MQWVRLALGQSGVRTRGHIHASSAWLRRPAAPYRSQICHQAKEVTWYSVWGMLCAPGNQERKAEQAVSTVACSQNVTVVHFCDFLSGEGTQCRLQFCVFALLHSVYLCPSANNMETLSSRALACRVMHSVHYWFWGQTVFLFNSQGGTHVMVCKSFYFEIQRIKNKAHNERKWVNQPHSEPLWETSVY